MTSALSSAQANSLTASAVSRLLRGGRVTKWKGKAASCAPFIGANVAASLATSVSSAALTAALAFGGAMLGTMTPAGAGSCTPGPVSVCSGPAGADVTQFLNPGAPLTVTTTAGFGMNTAALHALRFVGINGLTFTDANASTITGGFGGISATNYGAAGAVSVTSTGTVTGLVFNGITAQNNLGTDVTVVANKVYGGFNGIQANNFGTGTLSVTTTGTVIGSYSGIEIFTNGISANVNAVDTTGGTNGIKANNFGTGALSITSTGTATGTTVVGISAQNQGTGTDLTINAVDATGARYGIAARNYGTGALSVTSTGTATGTNLIGIYALNFGADLTISAVDTTGGANGISARNNGSGTLSVTSTGTATGTNGSGITARNSGTDLTIDAVDTNGGAYGIAARNYGTGTLSVTSTGTATGTDRYGIYALNTVNSTDLTINAATVNGGSKGIIGRNNGTGALSITATGTVTGTAFVGIQGFNSVNGANMTISAVDTNGGRTGIYAVHNGSGALSVTSTGTATGTTYHGIFALSSGNSAYQTITANNAIGLRNGIEARDYGYGQSLITTSGTVTGTTGMGILIAGSDPSDAFIVNSGLVQGGIAGIEAASGSGRTTTISNTGTVQNLAATSASTAIRSFNTVTIINNSNLVLGTVTLSGPSGTFNNQAAGTWNTAGGSNYFGVFADSVANSGLVLAANNAGSTETTTFNNLETFQNNAGGALRMNDGAVGDRTVLTGGGGAGNFAGNGGGIYVDTLLNAGGNPFADSDVLVIGGDSSGTSTLFVGATGAGALTAGDGILVVQVDGASNGVFSLGNAPLTAGAFIYKLFQNGIADPTNGDWYLRSNYLPTIPTYESYANVLLGLNNLPTLQQRVGNRFWAGEGNVVIAQGDGGPSSAPEAAPSPDEAAASVFIEENAIWTRIEGAHGHYAPDVSTAGSQFDASQWRAQAGVDFLAVENGDGKLIGGITAHYGQASADVTAAAGDGSIDATGTGLGATLTWYGNNGFYVDAQGSYSWYDSDLGSDDFASSVEGNDGSGYALSVETGKRIDLNNGWTTTPQAQLVYSKVDFDDFTGPLGELVSLQQGDSLKGRLGITADREASWQGDGGDLRRSHVYAIANLHYEFLDGTEINVAGTSFSQRQDKLWGELGLGGSYNWADDKYSLYGEADISTSLANFAGSYELSGTAGFRVKF